MKLQLLTPQAEVCTATVYSVTIPGAEGEFQVLPGHTFFLTLVQAGELRFESDAGKESRFTIGEGHAEVAGDVVTVAVDRAEAV